MVAVESLAAGTPVVGTRDGAIPEFITDPAIGRLFDPGPEVNAEASNASGLADAMDEALDLAKDPETAMNCRRFAERFSWERVGPKYEALADSLVRPRRRDERAEVSR